MENNPFDTSFIPEQPKVAITETKRQTRPVNFALVLALVIFFASVAATVGMYIYRNKIEKRIEAKKVVLADKEKKINLEAIRELERIETRLSTAKRLLNEHAALSPILDLLQDETLKNIGYTKFSFQNELGKPKLSLSAIATGYNSMYVQEQQLKKIPHVKDAYIETFNLDEIDGTVKFSIAIEPDVSLLNYRKYFNEKLAPVEVLPTIDPSASSTTP